MDQLYENGTIVTMDRPETAEAVLVREGRVAAVGRRADFATLGQVERVDLEGRTLLPAFLDAHSHFTAAANAQLQADLTGCASFAAVRQRIEDFIRSRGIPAGQWVTAQGYDHTMLAEGVHPTLALLDAAAPEHPLLLQHQSGHVGVVNTLGLKRLGITPETKAPSGGVIGVKDGRLTGYLEENAFLFYQKQLPMPSGAELLAAYRLAQDLYLSHGITTVQEGLLAPQMVPLYRAMLGSGLLQVDLVGYGEEQSGDALRAALPEHVGRYHRHFKLAGYKIFLDGSPQGRTAWMRQPYAGEADYRGYPTMSDGQVCSALRHSARDGMQLLAHCNGDAAAEQLLRCAGQVEEEGLELAALRPAMVHAQLLGRDQLAAVQRTGLLLSFFPNHIYHWGDVHIQSFGWDRAAAISPAASALRRGIPFTFHQDTPVLPPDMLESVWCAVNRRTRAGKVLAGEAVTAAEGLRAVTVNAAYQYFEEGEKGSIRPGKRADFVLLDQNPLETDPQALREVRVLATIKDGRTLWQAPGL